MQPRRGLRICGRTASVRGASNPRSKTPNRPNRPAKNENDSHSVKAQITPSRQKVKKKEKNLKKQCQTSFWALVQYKKYLKINALHI